MFESLEKKEFNQIDKIFVKLGSIFNDLYITSTKYVLSIDVEKPYVVNLEDKDLELLKRVFGEFKIINIFNMREFRKAMKAISNNEECDINIEDTFVKMTSDTAMNKVINLLNDRVMDINSCGNWERFYLSEDEEENEKLITSLFKSNDYINFTPKDSDSPEIIFTKSLLPLVSEKNISELYYASHKKSDDLYLIVFYLKFQYFELFMIHYYIPVTKMS